MTKVILEIQNDSDLRLLLSLLERLEINHWVNGEATSLLSFEEHTEHYRIIDKGVSSPNIEERLKSLDEDRKDRNLPYR